jgi:hypothetical protein
MDASELSALPPSTDDRGRGSLWLATSVAAQLLVVGLALGGAFTQVEAAPPALLLGLSAATVVEPGDGDSPGTLDAREAWPEGARLQLSFEVEQESWVAVLWFEGHDRVVPLYPSPARGQTGWTEPGHVYVVPGDGAFLRLTSTGPGGDFVTVVAAQRPDPEVERVLLDPQPAAVRSLRQRLEAEEAARTSALAGVVRHLPTADGRAVAVPWEEVRGTRRLVLGWDVVTE